MFNSNKSKIRWSLAVYFAPFDGNIANPFLGTLLIHSGQINRKPFDFALFDAKPLFVARQTANAFRPRVTLSRKPFRNSGGVPTNKSTRFGNKSSVKTRVASPTGINFSASGKHKNLFRSEPLPLSAENTDSLGFSFGIFPARNDNPNNIISRARILPLWSRAVCGSLRFFN